MKHFFIKTLLLMAALLLCVVYGMEVAKHNMMTMVGQAADQKSGLVSNLKTPIVSPSPSATSSSHASTKTNQSTTNKSTSTQSASATTSSNQKATGGDDLDARIKKLNTIQTFNPYSSLGESLSNGLQTTFAHGMAATSSLFNHLLEHVF